MERVNDVYLKNEAIEFDEPVPVRERRPAPRRRWGRSLRGMSNYDTHAIGWNG